MDFYITFHKVFHVACHMQHPGFGMI